MSYESPASILYDVNSQPMAVSGGISVPLSTSALLVAAMSTDGVARTFHVDTDGTLFVTGSFTTTPSGIQTVTGSVALSQTATVTGSITVPNTVTVTGSVSVLNIVTTKEANAASSAVTRVTASTTSETILASNGSRLGAIIYNDSSSKLFLKLGAVASTGSFTTVMFPNSYYETPSKYSGIIDGIWTTATGAAMVTELS